MLTKKPPVILTVDWKLPPEPFWLKTELEKLGYEVFLLGIPDYTMKNRQIRWRKLLLWGQYLLLGQRGAHMASRMDGIVLAWNFVSGAMGTLFLPPGQTRTIGLNMIATDKGRLNHIMRSLVYNKAFLTRRMIATVNSDGLCERYESLFKVGPEQLSVLHDPWWPEYEICPPGRPNGGYIFSGGEAARDWNTYLTVAKHLPGYSFRAVARKKYWLQTDEVPANTRLQFDLSDVEFYEQVKNADLVILPLKGQVTAGLIVLIRSALLGKAVITTETSFIRPYFPPDCSDLLVQEGDYAAIEGRVAYYFTHSELAQEKAAALQQHIRDHFHPHQFAARVSQLIQQARAA